MSNFFTPPFARMNAIVARAREQVEADALVRATGFPMPLPQPGTKVVIPEELLVREPPVVKESSPPPQVVESSLIVEDTPIVEETPIEELPPEDTSMIDSEEFIDEEIPEDVLPVVKKQKPEFSPKMSKHKLLDVALASDLVLAPESSKAEILKALEEFTAD